MSCPNAAAELMVRNLERHPDKTAYLCDEQSMTYRELDSAARRFASLLTSRGVAPGDSVMIVLPDNLAFPVAFLGSVLAGAMAVAVNTILRNEDFAYILDDCGARLVVTHPSMAGLVSLAAGKADVVICGENGCLEVSGTDSDAFSPYQPSDSDFAYMLYSSGSTGRPKGVPHTHRHLVLPCTLIGGPILGISRDDVIFSASKFSFAYGLINSLSFPLYFGATAVIFPGKPDAATLLGIISRRTPTVFFSVPTTYTQIVLSCRGCELKLPMRLCYSAGEALPAALYEEWKRLTGLEIIDGIGSTEATWVFISNYPGYARPGSAGRLVPGYLARIVDDREDDVAPGTPGDLLISGDTLAPYYWNRPEATGRTMLTGGYMKTGDIFVEIDGYYYHQGRSDDMIKVDANWVSPLQVEDVLRCHPAVADCAVAGVQVCSLIKPGAFVILARGVAGTPALERELREHVLSSLYDYMCPVRFRFLDDLPRTSTGKVQRFKLREIK